MISHSLLARKSWQRCRTLTKGHTAPSGQSTDGRRVGKSELILQFGKNRPTLYLVGKRAPADQMMREFLEGAAIFLEEPLLASMPVESWKKTIEAVIQRWGKKDKLILVFDEFQWLVEKSPELPSVLQELWDRSWSGATRSGLPAKNRRRGTCGACHLVEERRAMAWFDRRGIDALEGY
jgi:hypothetical protein